MPAIVGSASTYPLRNSSDLQLLLTNSHLYYTSLLPSAVRDWNAVLSINTCIKHFVDSPYSTRGDIEDTNHFLLVCSQCTDLRRGLINSVLDICQPNLNVLLCGDISLTFDQNKQIFKAVQDFIIKSKRLEYAY